MAFIKKLKALPEVSKGINSRTERGKGEAKKLVSLLLDLSGPQRGHVFDLRVSPPRNGFPHGLHASWHSPHCQTGWVLPSPSETSILCTL